MQLFTRRVQMTGPPAELMAYYTEMQAFASGLAGREIALWNIVMGAPVGSAAYTMRVEGLADLSATMQAIVGDAEYTERVSGMVDRIAAPTEDTIATVLHGELGDESPPVGAYGVVTSALIGNGAYADAVAWGVDVAQYASQVGGLPVIFTMDGFGDFGRVNWVSVGPDVGSVDNSLNALTADAGYVERMGQTGDLFVPGSGTRMLAYRAA